MAGKGPPKMNTARLKNRGSRLVNGRKDEPLYGGLTETWMPAGFGYHGKKMWKRLLPLLTGQGVLTNADIAGLERYCFLWDQWKLLTKPKRDEEGNLLEVDINKLMKLESGFSKLEQQFGLTPASRPNIKASKPESKEDKTKRFFKVG